MEKKEKKNNKWIIIIIVILVLVAGFVSGFYCSKSGVFGRPAGEVTQKGGIVDIWYGKRVVIVYDENIKVDYIMGGLVGDDDTYNEKLENMVKGKRINKALEIVAQSLYSDKIITDSNNVLFVHATGSEDSKKLVDTFENAFISQGLKSVNIIHYDNNELSQEAKDYGQLNDDNLSRINYISMIAKQENKTIDDYVNKTNKELFVLYSDSGKTNNNTNTNTTSSTNTNTQTKERCNPGYVYINDGNKNNCLNFSDVRGPIGGCSSGAIEIEGSCYEKASESLCSEDPERYVYKNGMCVDNYSVSTTNMNCPSGYVNTFATYNGKWYSGDCVRYHNPNY